MNHEEYAAELLAHIGRLTNGHKYPSGLTAAQWMAIRYFARANHMSRTVSAFAEFHATTRGTASQTVKSLVERGFLLRIASKQDGRSQVINLTRKGQKFSHSDPIQELELAVSDLPTNDLKKLVKILERIVSEISSQRAQNNFGKCPNCRFLDQHDYQGSSTTYKCNFADESLNSADLGLICINFKTSPRRR